jgi:hypothetical protein
MIFSSVTQELIGSFHAALPINTRARRSLQYGLFSAERAVSVDELTTRKISLVATRQVLNERYITTIVTTIVFLHLVLKQSDRNKCTRRKLLNGW